jgi:hypothetical protein
MISQQPELTIKGRASSALALIARGWWAAPLIVAVAYLMTLATQLSQIIAGVYMSPDSASAPVIGELFHAGGGIVLLGHLGWYSALLFELSTRWLPGHRQLWEFAPYALALCSAAVMGWGVSRVAGRWGAAITVTAVICLAPSTLSLLLVLNDHSETWFTVALLSGLLVALEEWPLRYARWPAVLLSGVVGIVLGLNAASDALLLVAGAGPLLLALALTWIWLPSDRSRRAALDGFVCAATAIASYLLLRALMSHWHVMAAVDTKTTVYAGAGALSGNFELWWQSVMTLADGEFFGLRIGFTSTLALVCALMAIVAVALAARLTWRTILSAATTRRESRTSLRRLDLAWTIYWGVSLVALSLVFIVSGMPEGPPSDRYLVGILLAAAALLPLLARGSIGRQAIATGAVTLYAFTGWLGLTDRTLIHSESGSPSYALANAVAREAHREHLTVGYGSYLDAAPITWATHTRVKVFPVDDCDGNQHLCAYEEHILTSWYTPRPGVKTFLLTDPNFIAASAPTPDLGKPLAVHQFGAVTMYVYPYDIAARLYAL